MKKIVFDLINVCLVLSLVAFWLGAGYAEIYRYKDKDGNWRFTDNPSNIPNNSEKMNYMIENEEFPEDISSGNFKPQTKVERDVLGTIVIETSAGTGTGFFITKSGFLLTNRHLILAERSEGAQNVEIKLPDKSKKNARIISKSDNFDLALLKLDSAAAYSLKHVDSKKQLVQGDVIYALGNPDSLKNAIAAGRFLGIEHGLIKTDAHVYDKNSGGPLVNKDGIVVGINLYNEFTQNFPGFGFAIPIDVALNEFRGKIQE